MATVCGASLALMDAGVPISSQVAGIAMGLVVSEKDHIVLSDILGDEDALGDMDFKVAGSAKGITALQMDIKVKHIEEQVFNEALDQAYAGIEHILTAMNQVIDKPREEVAAHAPQVIQMQINPSKISAVIGRGGSTIREMIEKYEVAIDINDSGLVKISGKDRAKLQSAKKQIESITLDIKVSGIYDGKITKIMDFGAFVNIAPGKDALLHKSQIAYHRVENIHNELSEGQLVKIQIIEVDEKQNRIKASMKDVPQTA